jgi:hypothetical protein
MRYTDRVTRRKSAKPFNGAIQIYGLSEDGERFAKIIRTALDAATAGPGVEDMHSLLVELADKYNAEHGPGRIRIGSDIRGHMLPESWRSLLFADVRPEYIAGRMGEDSFVGTDQFALVCPAEITALALANGFDDVDVDPYDLTGPEHTIDLGERGVEDDAIIEIDGVRFLRSTLDPIVSRGAKSGFIVRGRVLACPGIGYVRGLEPEPRDRFDARRERLLS